MSKASQETVITLYKKTTCPQCTKIEPVWEKLKAAFKDNHHLKFREVVDSPQYKRYQPHVPCIVVHQARKVIVFPSQYKTHTITNLKQFVKSILGSSKKSVKGGCGCGGAEP